MIFWIFIILIIQIIPFFIDISYSYYIASTLHCLTLFINYNSLFIHSIHLFAIILSILIIVN
jgi:hypothetical protein